MFIFDMFDDIDLKMKYQSWNEYTNVIPIHTLTVQTSIECNLNCGFCIVRNRKSIPFNYEKFYSFLDRILKNFHGNEFILNITGGELTVFDKIIFFNFIKECISIGERNNIFINFYFLTNLLKLDEDHLELFKILNKENRIFIRTSSDCYHHLTIEKQNSHIKNIQRVLDVGVDVLVNIVTDGKEDIGKLKSRYNELDVTYDIVCRKVFVDLNKDIENIKNTLQFNPRGIFYIASYSYNNVITPCILPSGHDWKRYTINPDNINSMDELKNTKVYRIFNFLADYAINKGQDPTAIDIITFYYENEYVNK